jgi:hypothetical protein
MNSYIPVAQLSTKPLETNSARVGGSQETSRPGRLPDAGTVDGFNNIANTLAK